MEIERANSAAVESCHRVVNLLSQPQDRNLYRNLLEQTGDAVSKFKKVVSLLNSSCGHARVRKLQKIQAPLPLNTFLENPICKSDEQQPKPLQINNSVQEIPSNVKNALNLEIPSLELRSNGKIPLPLAQQTPLPSYHFIQQQQQQLKHQAEMMYRLSNSGSSLNFDSSTCTPTMSFISSLSMDGSVDNVNGSSLGLIGTAPSANQSFFHHKKRCSGRGEGGSSKCGGSGRCHCSKKRKHRVKRSIKVPAISNKLADIPPDDYSWRKYGQKPIKGSPYPR